MTVQFHDLQGVEVEHLLSTTFEGVVKLRAISADHILLGQLTPDQARNIAAHLFEAAARAEYEQDLFRAAKAHGLDDPTIGAMFHLVREGETGRLS